jgi:hypothetical protein
MIPRRRTRGHQRASEGIWDIHEATHMMGVLCSTGIWDTQEMIPSDRFDRFGGGFGTDSGHPGNSLPLTGWRAVE